MKVKPYNYQDMSPKEQDAYDHKSNKREQRLTKTIKKQSKRLSKDEIFERKWR